MAAKKMNLEENFQRMDEIISRLSDEKLSLEESFKLYKAGMNLVKASKDSIDKVEQQVRLINDETNTDEA
jgi:exodeoxyribonuclease VII small subunit